MLKQCYLTSNVNGKMFYLNGKTMWLWLWPKVLIEFRIYNGYEYQDLAYLLQWSMEPFCERSTFLVIIRNIFTKRNLQVTKRLLYGDFSNNITNTLILNSTKDRQRDRETERVLKHLYPQTSRTAAFHNDAEWLFLRVEWFIL